MEISQNVVAFSEYMNFNIRWIKGNDIETGSTTGSNYWSANASGEKIKTNGLKEQTQTDVNTH